MDEEKLVGDEVKKVDAFKYLGCVVAYNNIAVPVARRQLQRARAIWRHRSKVIAKEIVPALVAGMFYVAVTAAVLLYGSNSLVLEPRMELLRQLLV